MIKSVLNFYPVYAMKTCLIPSGVLDYIEKGFSSKYNAMTPLAAELLALREGLSMAKAFKIKKIRSGDGCRFFDLYA